MCRIKSGRFTGKDAGGKNVPSDVLCGDAENRNSGRLPGEWSGGCKTSFSERGI